MGLLPFTSCKSRQPQVSDPHADDAARQLIGMDHPFEARPVSSDDLMALERSMERRRLFGWQTLQSVFKPVALPGNSSADGAERMALWQTWYTSDEIVKMFEILYRTLPPEQRATETNGVPTAAVPEAQIECVLKKYASEERLKKRHGAMFNARVLKRIAQLKDRPGRSVNGVAKGMTLFNLPVARHFLANYAQVIRCTKESVEAYQGDLQKNFASCFLAEFPRDAVAMKALWARDDEQIPTFDTSAEGVEAALTQPKAWRASCATPPCSVAASDPALDKTMFSTKVKHPDQSENTFRLTALHVATKEIRDWTWTTLWWSDKPDEDFGADRPSWFGTYGNETVPELAHYKMCNTVGYREKDQALLAKRRGFKARPGDKSLEGALLASLTSGNAQPQGTTGDDVATTWCSNPYVERDPDMSDTNCIGCHQHAEPEGDMHMVRDQQRQAFPSDYAWSFEFYMDMIGKDNDNFKSKFAAVTERDHDLPVDACQ